MKQGTWTTCPGFWTLPGPSTHRGFQANSSSTLVTDAIKKLKEEVSEDAFHNRWYAFVTIYDIRCWAAVSNCIAHDQSFLHELSVTPQSVKRQRSVARPAVSHEDWTLSPWKLRNKTPQSPFVFIFNSWLVCRSANTGIRLLHWSLLWSRCLRGSRTLWPRRCDHVSLTECCCCDLKTEVVVEEPWTG